ncbi:hypothetical protein H1R20_g174, partial [Candolleomyces eurysporus]
MPPPPIPPSVLATSREVASADVERPSKLVYPPPVSLQTPEVTRIVPIRNPGFKPIGKPNSALKRFFPGDEEDHESTDNIQRQPRTYPPSNFQQSGHHPESNGHYGQNGSAGPYPPRIAPEYDNQASWSPSAPQDYDPWQATWPNEGTPNWHVGTPEDKGFQDDGFDAVVHAQPQQQTANAAAYQEPKKPRSKNKAKDPPPHVAKLAPKPPETPVQASPAPVETPVKSSSASPKELYMILNQVGEGTFGKVYKAQNVVSSVFVALKRIRMETERDGFPVTAMREIKLLQSLKHRNVVCLYEMMSHIAIGSVFMVFEYMDHDLTGILSQTQFKFTDAHLKSLCHQMLAGLAYLHHKGVIHRDIKGSNILLNNRGELKLADFGLARFYQKRRRSDYTNRVITLWYRPPELLYGATIYGAEVDMWSAGCIMLELFTKKPVFQGNDEIHQLHSIFKILGTPTPERWLGLLNLPWYELVKPKEPLPNRFRDLFQRWMSPAALDLAEMLLTFDPSRRVSAQAAMETPYFTQEQPPAERPTGLSTLEGEWHELETKVERQKKRKKTESTTA